MTCMAALLTNWRVKNSASLQAIPFYELKIKIKPK